MRGLTKRGRTALIVLGCLTVLGVLLLLISGSLPKSRKENGIPELRFSVGDRLTGYPVTNHAGGEVDIAEVSENETLYIFGMAECGDCIADFPSYELVFSLYNSDDLSVVFIWDDAVPVKEMEEMGIPVSACYSAEGRYKFTDWVPSYYLMDAGDIIRKQTVEMAEAAGYLEDYPVSTKGFEMVFQGKQVLLGIERCKSCKGAYDRLLEQDEPFVYVLEGVEEATGGQQMADPHSILSRAFQIDAYPVCLYPDGNGGINVDPDC